MRNILLNIVLSFAIIFISHKIWDYFKHNYTTAKTKNVVEIQAAKYKQIMEDMTLSSAKTTDAPEKDESMAVITKDEQSKSLRFAKRSHCVPLAKPNPLVFLPTEEKQWIQKELDEFIDSL